MADETSHPVEVADPGALGETANVKLAVHEVIELAHGDLPVLEVR